MEPGFHPVGIAPADEFDNTERRFRRSVERGFNAGMAWITPERASLACRPQELLPAARSVVVVESSQSSYLLAMDLRFGPEEEAFRQELGAFLDRELPPENRIDSDTVGTTDEQYHFFREFDRKLAAEGWLCMPWPREYGGQDASIFMQVVFQEELANFGVHSTMGMAVSIVGPAIMVHGSPEQKERYLPGIARAEHEWCQGFSEPNAGSDLASLRTTAAETADGYVINGQKIWSSRAHHCDHCWLLARTDPAAPKHRGLSTFAVDMKTPGITTRPIVTMNGLSHFAEIWFDNALVPRDALVGEKNRGWYQAMTTLNFERSGIGRVAGLKRTMLDLAEYARQTVRCGSPLSKDPIVRQQIAGLYADVEAARMLCYRVAWLQSRGDRPSHEASMARVVGTELSQKVARVGMQILGLAGPLAPESPYAQLQGRLERMFLYTIANTIRSGTSEIQLNIIAQRGLGLPRSGATE